MTALFATSVAWCASELPTFESLDKDRDGRLSKSELPIELQGFFDKVDRDGDGFVSRLEDRGVRAFLRKQADAPPLAGVEVVKNVDYVGDGNPRQMLDIYRPKARGDEPLPVVCWIHGGGWRQGSKDRARRLEELVATGKYAGVSVGYRLTQEATWPAQIHDCKAAIRWLKANAGEYGFDASRVAVWGASAGGHLVAMLGVSEGDPKLEGKLGEHLAETSGVRCVVNFFGPSELLVMDEQGSVMNHSGPNSPESLLVGGPIAEFPEVAKEASPIHHVNGKAAPMLLVHGTADKLVPYGQSVKLAKALIESDVDAPLITIEGGGHGNGFGPAVDQVVTQYLGRQLLGEPGETRSQKFRVGE